MGVILDYGLRLPVHRMVKPVLEKSEHGGGLWGWMRNGDYYAKINYWIARQGPREAQLRLSYTRDGEAIAYDVRLVAEPCRFGGLRWFAICPATWFKVSKLYLPPGAKRFLARKAWKLAYASQHVAPGFDRLCDQRNRLLERKLKSNDPDFPLKPKGMRRSTYERHLDKLEYLHMAMDVAILQRFGMTADAILQRFGMTADAILNNSGNLDRKEE